MNINKTIVKKAEHKPKSYKLTDGFGLYLLVTPKGKYWRFDYRFKNKRKTLALGVYSEISLDEARDAHYQPRTYSWRCKFIGSDDPINLKAYVVFSNDVPMIKNTNRQFSDEVKFVSYDMLDNIISI